MGNYLLKKRKTAYRGQITLEMVLMFLAAVGLIAGVITMWAQSDDRIAQRQEQYEGSRLAAGSTAPGTPWGTPTFNTGFPIVKGIPSQCLSSPKFCTGTK